MQRGVVRRQFEAGRRDVVPLKNGVVAEEAHNRAERNLPIGIEAVIQADGGFAAMAGEGFLAKEFSQPHFRVTVGKTAARQTDRQVRVRAQDMTNAQLGIDIDRRDGQPQREVGLQEPRLVEIVKQITGERSAALKRLIVPELKEPSFFRIDLRVSRGRGAKTNQNHEPVPLRSPIHARCRNAYCSLAASGFVRADEIRTTRIDTNGVICGPPRGPSHGLLHNNPFLRQG